SLSVNAYGKTVFTYSFDPCDYGIKGICPLPADKTFSAKGTVNIPNNYAEQIPSIAFAIPDLDGYARLTLNNSDSGEEIACFQSSIT
ncbi:ML-like domain-containing protein, partial [Dipodascopsis uninucleata]